MPGTSTFSRFGVFLVLEYWRRHGVASGECRPRLNTAACGLSSPWSVLCCVYSRVRSRKVTRSLGFWRILLWDFGFGMLWRNFLCPPLAGSEVLRGRSSTTTGSLESPARSQDLTSFVLQIMALTRSLPDCECLQGRASAHLEMAQVPQRKADADPNTAGQARVLVLSSFISFFILLPL